MTTSIEQSKEEKALKAKKIKSTVNNVGIAALIVAVIVAIFFPDFASAYSTPSSSDPAYSLYDLFVDKGIKGVPGFVAAVWLLVNAGITIGSNPKLAALQAIGGGALIQADSLAGSLGYATAELSVYFTALI